MLLPIAFAIGFGIFAYWYYLTVGFSLKEPIIPESSSLPADCKILVWNMKLLPWPITRDAPKRAKAMLQNDIWKDADVVVLTEIIHPRAAKIIVTGLRDMGFNWGTMPLQQWPRLNGGILVAARIAPTACDWLVFDNSTFREADRLASKGVIRVSWDNCTLLATHLDAHTAEVNVRRKQVNQIRNLSPIDMTTLWAGDFNFDLKYDAFLYGLQSVTANEPTSFSGRQIDGVIDANHSGIQIHTVVHKIPGSDHWPLLADVKL